MRLLIKSITVFIITLFSIFFNTYAQQATPYTGNNIDFTVFKTNDTTLGINDVLNNPNNFKSPNSFKEKTNADDIYWIKLNLKNINDQNKNHFFLKFNSFDYGQLFFLDNQVSSKNIGLFDKNSIRKKIRYNNYYSEVKLASKLILDHDFLYLKVKRVTFNEPISNWKFNSASSSFSKTFSQNDLTQLIPYYIFAGICILAWFWSLSFFVMIKKPEFFYYSLYIITLFFYSCGYKLGIYQFLFKDNYTLLFWCSQSVVYFANLAYVFYIMGYLETKSNYPVFHKILKIVISFNLLTIIALFIFGISQNFKGFIFINTYLFNFYYLTTIPLLLYLIYIAKNYLAYFVAFATLSLCVSALAHILFVQPEDGLFLDSLYFIIIGCATEIIIFAFGLNYKARTDILEKFKLKNEASINKNQALRAQINPHFIFNSLSAIQHLITTDNKISTLKYLSKFSRLIRNVLENSIKTNVVISDEIKLLTDYLELESLRFDGVFNYKITVDKKIDTDLIEIPFMILQPFVENAIIHGLLPKLTGPKNIDITITKQNDFLVCKVDDNGIGREASNHKKPVQSRGLEVTKQRLDNLDTKINTLEIIDKKDTNQNPLGTTVIIKIQLK